MKNLLKNVYAGLDEGKYSAKEIVLCGGVVFLTGILLGILGSPKGTRMIGCFNGNCELPEEVEVEEDEE